MSARISSDMLVGALLRRVQAEGGNGAVIAKGDAGGGAVLLLCADRGVPTALLERALQVDGSYAWVRCGPDSAEAEALAAYLSRRRSRDPDLWIVELDSPEAQRFAAESSGVG